MGVSVMPVPSGQPSLADVQRVKANVAKMRAAGAPESDVLAYLQHEDSLSSATPTPLPSPSSTDLSFRNIGRSITQGATFGFGDEMGLVNREADKAFAAEHPIANFAGRMLGGLAAPAAAVAAAPALGTSALGAAALGGATGMLSGAGESEGSVVDRIVSGLKGGALGAAGGAASYGVAKGAGSVIGKLVDRFKPERAVKRAAASLIDPSVAAKLAEVDQIAPGGASIATTAIPATGDKTSRFLPMLRATGASPEAAASAEQNFLDQKGALGAARSALGAKMDALTGDIPVTPQGRDAVMKAAKVLGKNAPKASPTMPIQDLRTALSELRADARMAAKSGVNANGVRLHAITEAKDALQDYLYTHAPQFEQLDKPYAIVMQQLERTDRALKTVQQSRANYSANAAYGATSGSLGGSLPSAGRGAVMELIDKVLTNKAGAADAVARLVAKPGGPQLVDQIMQSLPQDQGVTRLVAPTASAAIPAMRGLLFPQQP